MTDLLALAARVEALTAFLDGSGPFPDEDAPLFWNDHHPSHRAFWWRKGLDIFREAAQELRARAAMEGSTSAR